MEARITDTTTRATNYRATALTDAPATEAVCNTFESGFRPTGLGCITLEQHVHHIKEQKQLVQDSRNGWKLLRNMSDTI